MKFVILSKKKMITAVAIILVAILCSITLAKSGASPVFFGQTVRKLPIYSVQTEEKKIAISFDCAWGVDYTDKLLATMQEKGVTCTFFMVEFWTKKYPEYVKKISDYGHEIGTHSSTHPHMSKLNKETIKKELETSTAEIEKITNKKVEVFRAPFGEYNDLVINTAMEMGLYTIQWDVDSLDWKDLSASEIKNRVINRVKNGSIVLFHNQGMHTNEALPDIIDALKALGYQFVPIGELIYRDNYTISADGTQIKNA